MNDNKKIAVLGGGGRTGKYLINKLLDKGYFVKILLRDPEKFEIKSPLIQIIQGDAIEISIMIIYNLVSQFHRFALLTKVL
jgi:putative NADH-flavin reductase